MEVRAPAVPVLAPHKPQPITTPNAPTPANASVQQRNEVQQRIVAGQKVERQSQLSRHRRKQARSETDDGEAGPLGGLLDETV